MWWKGRHGRGWGFGPGWGGGFGFNPNPGWGFGPGMGWRWLAYQAPPKTYMVTLTSVPSVPPFIAQVQLENVSGPVLMPLRGYPWLAFFNQPLTPGATLKVTGYLQGNYLFPITIEPMQAAQTSTEQ